MAAPGNDMAEMAVARANVYGLLADIYREEPSETLLARFREPEFSSVLRDLELSLDEMFENHSPHKLTENLAIEYTRLFLGPGSHISPNESMHVAERFGETNAFWSKQTVEVKKFMEAAGVAVADGFGGMPDHISAELEFMQMLLMKEAEAWNAGEEELGANIQEIEKRFYDEHLSQWIGNFCDKVIAGAEMPFYGQLAEMTKAFMAFESELFVDAAPTRSVGLA